MQRSKSRRSNQRRAAIGDADNWHVAPHGRVPQRRVRDAHVTGRRMCTQEPAGGPFGAALTGRTWLRSLHGNSSSCSQSGRRTTCNPANCSLRSRFDCSNGSALASNLSKRQVPASNRVHLVGGYAPECPRPDGLKPGRLVSLCGRLDGLTRAPAGSAERHRQRPPGRSRELGQWALDTDESLKAQDALRGLSLSGLSRFVLTWPKGGLQGCSGDRADPASE